MTTRQSEGWKHAADALNPNLRARIDAARRRHAEAVQIGHIAYGWPLDAECSQCGDTGKRPDAELCRCHAGEEIRLVHEQRMARLKHWHGDERIPKRFRDWTLDGHPNQDAATLVAAWVDDPAGRNLYLHGPVGVGKTGLAIGALRRFVERGEYPVRFWSVPDLLDQMRPDSPNDPMDESRSVPWLVLDDLGVERPSDWVRERLYVLINARYEAERPVIVTSNCDLVALADALSDRTVSRLADAVVVVGLDGDDLRGEAS